MASTVFLLLAMGTMGALAGPIIYPSEKNESAYSVCGEENPNNNIIDLSEPEKPGPFHDLTADELRKLREFLEKDPKIKASKSSNASINSSYIFTAELLLPKKEEVLNYLDKSGSQPARQARVVMFRGDKSPPRVEECVCGPLPDIRKCELMNLTSRRNPVEFSVRPLNGLEIKAIREELLKSVDEKVGNILKESYGAKFTESEDKKDVLSFTTSPVGTELAGSIEKRLMWVNAMFNVQFPSLHVLDFAVLVDLNGTDPSNWTVEKVWYSDKIFDSLEDLAAQYSNNSINKTKVPKPTDDENQYSSSRRRGAPQPPKPQRPPQLVEPDGKRYSVKGKKIEYMGWTANYRLSPLTGPAVYDIRYKGERIVYEHALNEIATFHSGFAPIRQTSDDVNSGSMLGSRSKSVVPGAGCPETATSLPATFMNQYGEEPAVYKAAWCLFENNNGDPLRRHLSYEKYNGAFYGGMLDSALTLRTALTVYNYDYVIDFIFHQNGALETKIMSTGYLQSTFYTSNEKKYGHRIQDHVLGNIHQHWVNFKVDMDIGGTSNRYETLEMNEEKLKLTAFPDKPYSQIKINSTLKKSEKEAVYDYNFSTNKYHVVHNNDKRSKYNESRGYRITMKSRSKSTLEPDMGNEKTVPWIRHQMVVTKRKDDEISSSSIYGMLDSAKPAVNFSSYYEDDEDIVDEDLVMWVTAGLSHIPHSEDIPIVTTTDSVMSFFLLPHNYFSECPSISSRDAIYIEHKDRKDPSKGVVVDRNGNSRDQCVVPRSRLEEEAEEEPDRILESRRKNPTDF